MQRNDHLPSVLDGVLPPAMITAAARVGATGKERTRLLTRETMCRLLVGMGLFRDHSIAGVLTHALEGLGAVPRWGPGEEPCDTAITQARDRLRMEAVRALFRAQAEEQGSRFKRETTWRGLSTETLDGSTLRCADTQLNDEAFGRPGASRGGRSAFPQVRVLALMAAGTHLIRHIVLGPYRQNELKLAEHMLPYLHAGTLLLLDRAFHSYSWLAALRQRGADFIVRAKADAPTVVKARKIERLGPRDWRCELLIPKSKRGSPDLPDKVPVRLITRGHKKSRMAVITSLLSPTDFPADEIVAKYWTRWEAELGYRELKTHLGRDRVPLRSKRPGRVLQEAYGLLTAFNSVRALMCEAAEEFKLLPLQLSFVESLRHIRRAVQAPGSSSHADLLKAISACVLPAKRVGRACARGVKIKSSNYPRKRPGQPMALTRRQRQRRNVAEKRAARIARETAARMELVC